MTADYELVQVSRLLGRETVKAQVVKDEQVQGEKERKVRSTGLSTLVWTMARRRCLVGVE